ncbi:endonuclease/exonuclease/phosphatase family protein [Parahaliea sp. F7430]|uniref:Endonuclease/exonuclease/phosphatase family protein n=1 Tax=Sediminihaliea albiluteola TaxID=2758564 RepID=A0A7W2YKH7_9GAMM|nr:endonuclease/exonuclease/phosphatase family protein [Sediminihaliea albiluteola]MBA6413719.1 endonuclease/exonuclease/phosphatase family protein [Sediminihaliea albiluteola]
MLETYLLLLTLLLAVTLLPLSRKEVWWIRDLDFPRLQLALLALLLLVCAIPATAGKVVAGLPLAPVALLLSAGCLIYQLWWILPYTRLFPPEVKAARHNSAATELTILTSNVLTPNRNADALLDLVARERPDVLVTLESDQWWQDQLDSLLPDYPYALKCPLDNLYGMHVYSRLPLEDGQIEYLVEDKVPSMHGLLRLPNGCGVRVHFLHPAPPSPTENAESAERDAELIMVAKSVQKASDPVIVTGDLNDVAWSETTRLFRKISALLDPRIGRGMFNTFHADYWFFRWPLDHLFHSEHFTLVNIRRLANIGSDHFPLLTTLAFEPLRGSEQEGVEAGADDRALARKKLDQQEVKVADVPEPGAP